MKKIILSIVLILLCFSFATSGAFRDLGNGARAISFGLAYVAVADNPYAMFYNPAGIGQIKKFKFASTYSRLYPFVQDEDLYYLTLAGVVPIFSIFDFGTGVSYFKTGMWSENQFVFSVAREFKYLRGLSIGGNLKLLRWSALAPVGESSYSYFGFTFDAGVVFVWREFTNGSNLRFGLVAKNITQPSIAMNKSEDAKLPLEIVGGMVYESKNYGYQVGLGFLRSSYSDLKIDVGFEIQAFSSEFLRNNLDFVIRASGGVKMNTDKQVNLNPGFGIRYWKIRIDYAYVHQFEMSDAGGSHKFSIEFNL